MLLVKGSSYSEMKGTVAKDMLHGAYFTGGQCDTHLNGHTERSGS